MGRTSPLVGSIFSIGTSISIVKGIQHLLRGHLPSNWLHSRGKLDDLVELLENIETVYNELDKDASRYSGLMKNTHSLDEYWYGDITIIQLYKRLQRWLFTVDIKIWVGILVLVMVIHLLSNVFEQEAKGSPVNNTSGYDKRVYTTLENVSEDQVRMSETPESDNKQSSFTPNASRGAVDEFDDDDEPEARLDIIDNKCMDKINATFEGVNDSELSITPRYQERLPDTLDTDLEGLDTAQRLPDINSLQKMDEALVKEIDSKSSMDELKLNESTVEPNVDDNGSIKVNKIQGPFPANITNEGTPDQESCESKQSSITLSSQYRAYGDKLSFSSDKRHIITTSILSTSPIQTTSNELADIQAQVTTEQAYSQPFSY